MPNSAARLFADTIWRQMFEVEDASFTDGGR